MIFTIEQIEWLKNYFMSKPIEVTELPKPESIEADYLLAILKSELDNTDKLYLYNNGEWRLIESYVGGEKIVPDPVVPGGSGEANTASNLGLTGEGVYAQKVGVDLQFKKLSAGANISLSSDSEKITIAGSAGGEANTASNVGLGEGHVFKQKSGVDLQLKTIKAGTNVTITDNIDDITIASTDTGEANTASNLGAGEGLYASKSGVDLRFKSIMVGTGLTISSDATSILIDVTAMIGMIYALAIAWTWDIVTLSHYSLDILLV